MSTGAQVAVLDARGVGRTRQRSDVTPVERPRVRMIAFGGLALYGALRWGSLLSPTPVWRLLGLFAVAVLLAALVPGLHERNRPLAIAVALIAVISIFPLAGIPFSWVRHVRIAVATNEISEGLSALPRALVPYNGINQSVRTVIMLGAGVLLIDAGLMMAFAPRPISELRRAGAALPLVVLAVVPSTLARPSVTYLHGLILFALLAAFIWGERVPRYDVPLAVGFGILAATAGMIAAPELDQHSPWLNYEALAGTLAPGHIESFDWSQRYGPLNWPRTGREVLDVQAKRADYWKAEDLDLFDGTGWVQGYIPSAQHPPPPEPSAVKKWTQTITVSLRAMRTSNVIAAGVATAPQHVGADVTSGYSPGTWVTASDLEPGDTYSVVTYSPQPTSAQLGTDTATPPDQELAGYRSIVLPAGVGLPTAPEITFPPFHSHAPVMSLSGIYGADGAAVVRSSPYAQSYALAKRLAHESSTSYQFVRNVMRYLAKGYTYSENPLPSRYPIETFLFNDKAGYCQQFAGAMALLLRMGGVPARVAAGFTSGTLDKTGHRYVVSDIDAHAWVEVWFPRYGWVRFDPTPAAAPARGGHVPLLPALRGGAAAAAPIKPVRKPEQVPAGSNKVGTSTHGGGTSALVIALAIIVPLALIVLVLALTARWREPKADELLGELERALKRTGRPASGGVTLAALEHRYRDSDDAVGYVRALRLMRFGAGTDAPTRAQRRALRGELRAGLGPFGRLRALWALPPRWTPVRRAPSGGIHSE